MNLCCLDCCSDANARGRGLIQCPACTVGLREPRDGDVDCVVCTTPITDDASDPAHLAAVVHNLSCTHSIHTACLAGIARETFASNFLNDEETTGVVCPFCRASWHSCGANQADSQDRNGYFQRPLTCAICSVQNSHPRCEHSLCDTCCTVIDCTSPGEHRSSANRSTGAAERRQNLAWNTRRRNENIRVSILATQNNRRARNAARHEDAAHPFSPTGRLTQRSQRNSALRWRVEASVLPPADLTGDDEHQSETQGNRMTFDATANSGPCLVIQRIDPENGVLGENEREGIAALVRQSDVAIPLAAGLPVLVLGNRPTSSMRTIQRDSYSCGQHSVQAEVLRRRGVYGYEQAASCIANGSNPNIRAIEDGLGVQEHDGVLSGTQIETAIETWGEEDVRHCGPHVGATSAMTLESNVWERRMERARNDITLAGGFGITLNTAAAGQHGHWVHYSVYYSANGQPRGYADHEQAWSEIRRRDAENGDETETENMEQRGHGRSTSESQGTGNGNSTQSAPFPTRVSCDECGITRRGTPENDRPGPTLCQSCVNRAQQPPLPPSPLPTTTSRPPPRPPPFGSPRPPPSRQITCGVCLRVTSIDVDHDATVVTAVECRCGAQIIPPPPSTLEEKQNEERDSAPAMEPDAPAQRLAPQQPPEDEADELGPIAGHRQRGGTADRRRGARAQNGGDGDGTGGDSGSETESDDSNRGQRDPNVPPGPPPPPPPPPRGIPAEPEQHDWLDEVSWDQIAAMVQETTQVKNIPRSMRDRFKAAMNTTLRIVTEPDSALTIDQIGRQRERGAKLISLLPSMALRREKANQTVEMAVRLDKIKERQWESLYREHARALQAQPPREAGPGPTASSRIARASALLAIGEISRAMRQLTAGGMCPTNTGTLEALRELHPAAVENWEDGDWPEMGPDSPRIQIQPKYFTQALRSMARGSAAGVTGLRADWLRLMLPAGESHTTAESNAQDAGEDPDLKPLRAMVELLMNGELGVEASKFFGSAKLCALEKLNGEPRPLAIGDALRRLGARAVMKQHEDTFASLLAPLGQMGVAVPGAADKIALIRRLRIERDPDRAIVAIDTRNAYNTCCRRRILHNLKQHPELHFLIPSFKAFYASNPHLFYAMDGEVGIVESKTGVQQGDGLAALYYSIGTMDSLQELKEQFVGQGLCILAYIDDVTFDCPPELAPRIYAAWSEILNRRTHQTCRPEKTKIWSPRADLTTPQMQEALSEFKVAPMGGMGAGIIVMGVAIGTHAYETAYVEHVTFAQHQEIFGPPRSLGMEDEYAKISQMPTRQEAFLLQRYCQGTTRVNHFMRGIEGDRVNPSLARVDSMGIKAIENAIAGPTLSDVQRRQTSLPLGMGGLALRSAVDTRRGAWVASWATAVGTKHPIQQIDPTLAAIVRNPDSFRNQIHTVQILLDEWAIITAPAPPGTTPNALRHSVQRVNAGLKANTWLNQYGKAWRTSHVVGGIEEGATVLLQPPPVRAQHESDVAQSWDTSSASIDSTIAAMPPLDRLVVQARHDDVPASLLEPWAKDTKTHQRHLTAHSQRVTFLENIAAMIGHNTEIGVLRSNSTFQAFSRFDAVPSRHGFVANDPTWMRMAWKRVTGAADPRTTGGPDRCPCCGAIMRENSHADSCRAGARSIMIHNEIRNVFQLACKAAGVTTTREQRHLLPLVGSGNTRPGDVTFLTPEGVTICVDVGVAAFTPQRDVVALATAKAGSIADDMDHTKNSKRHELRLTGEMKTMAEHCRTYGLEYMPACVDNAGAWGHNMRALINRLGGYAHAAHGIPPHIFTLAWTRRISLALARVQALAATQRIAELAPVGDLADLGATMEAQGLFRVR